MRDQAARNAAASEQAPPVHREALDERIHRNRDRIGYRVAAFRPEFAGVYVADEDAQGADR